MYKSLADDCLRLCTVRLLPKSPDGRSRLPGEAILMADQRASLGIPVRELSSAGARVLFRHSGEMYTHHFTKYVRGERFFVFAFPDICLLTYVMNTGNSQKS